MKEIKYKFCKCCGSVGTESHHIIFRSQLKGLINCKLNQVYLCNSCHNFLHKSKRGFELDYMLKIEFQNLMELIFDRQAFTLDEIKEALDINYNAAYGLSKFMKLEKGKYTRESIILAICGGELPTERIKKIKEGVKNKP